MSETNTKLTQEEMQTIASLRAKYQEKMFKLGQVKFDEISVQDALKRLKEKEESLIKEWKEVQEEEQGVLKTLAEKYGDGSLNLNDGTFTPVEKVDTPEVVADSGQSGVIVPDFSQSNT